MNQKGNKNRVKFQTYGLEGRTEKKGEFDLYETNPIYIDDLFMYEKYENDGSYYEPCWGLNKYIYNRLKEDFDVVNGGDIIDGNDFLSYDENNKVDYIITNPPFNLSLEFVEKMFKIVNKKFSLILPLNYLDTMKRFHVFHNENFKCKNVLIYSKRIGFQKGGGLPDKCISGMSFCWITWEKNYTGDTLIKWIKNF